MKLLEQPYITPLSKRLESFGQAQEQIMATKQLSERHAEERGVLSQVDLTCRSSHMLSAPVILVGIYPSRRASARIAIAQDRVPLALLAPGRKSIAEEKPKAVFHVSDSITRRAA